MAFKRRRMAYDNNVDDINYKAVSVLMNYVDSSNKIIGRRQTGLTAKKQRELQKAIKRARTLGLMPY